MVKIGIIGTGMLGEAVGLHLLDSGYSVSVYNRTKSKTKNLEEKGAHVAEIPSVVAKSSDLIITCVKDADAVKQVLFGQGGVVSGKHDDMTVADMSTINPNAAKEISKKLHDKEIKSIEIPVMGGPNVAIDGKLVLMASGDKESFERFSQVFNTIANKTFFLGESGSAHSIKLAMNLQISLLALSLSEGITLTKKAGFDPEIFLEILNSTYFSTGNVTKQGFQNDKRRIPTNFHAQKHEKGLGHNCCICQGF